MISSGVLNLLCPISPHHPRKSRGRGSGKHIVREDSLSAVSEIIMAPVPSGIVHSEIWSFTQSSIPERSTVVYSIPGTVPGVVNAVIKKPDSSLQFHKADI